MASAARGGRCWLIDIAVPRDIEPACREIAGVSLHDIDDVQQIVERNASGREAEAQRAERIIEAELDRFERWLASLEVVPTIAALRERGDEVVRRVLAENETRWESLSEADRERLEAMAKAIASRLLHEPTLRMRRSAGSEEAYFYVSALRELFGLDVETEPEAEAGGSVTELQTRTRQGFRLTFSSCDCGYDRWLREKVQDAPPLPGSPRAPGTLDDPDRHSQQRTGADPGRQVAEMLGGAELVEASSDGEPGDKSRFVRGVERALLAGEAEIGVHSAKDLPGEMPDGLEIAAVPPREDPADVWIGAGSSLDDVPEGARVGTASLRRRAQLLAARPGPAGGGAARQRRHPPAQARRGRARRDRPRRRRAAPARARERDRLPDPGRGRWSRRRARGRWSCRSAPATRRRPRRLSAIFDDATPLRELTAERAAVRLLDASCTTPVGVHARVEGERLEIDAFVGLPDGSEWLRDRIEADAAEPAAAGVLLAERLLSAGARELLDRAEAMAEPHPDPSQVPRSKSTYSWERNRGRS